MIRCCKCAGLGTRAHHRLCDKRGDGHLGRGERVRWTQARAAEWNVALRVRRGRGPGLSLPAARALLLRAINGVPRGSAADVRDLVARALDCKPKHVKVLRSSAGEVRVQVPSWAPMAKVATAERALFDAMPADTVFILDRQQTPSPPSATVPG